MLSLSSWWVRAAIGAAIVAVLMRLRASSSAGPSSEPRVADTTLPASLATLDVAKGADPRAVAWKASHVRASAFVVGGSGAVGKALVSHLLASPLFEKVVVLGRRRVEYEGAHGAKLEQHSIDFDDLGASAHLFKGHAAGFICLGTTRAKAGAEGFVKVDRTYVAAVGRAAMAAGVPHVALVSAANANAGSWLLYPQTKGQAELDLMQLGFERLSVFRPALLVGDRGESRPLEALLVAVLPALEPILMPRRLTIRYEAVALAMLRNVFMPERPMSLAGDSGVSTSGRADAKPMVEIIHNSRMRELAEMDADIAEALAAATARGDGGAASASGGGGHAHAE